MREAAWPRVALFAGDIPKAALMELFGTFMLVLVGAAAGATEQGLVVGALAHGGIVIGVIYSYGHFSGAHINPAVTAGLLVGNQITLPRAIAYWIAQCVGSLMAAFLLRFMISDSTNLGHTVGTLTGEHVWMAALFELILTFLLVSTVYQAGVFKKGGNLAGFIIGFTLIGLILAGSIYTGASLNPARTLGPALATGNLSYLLPYGVGILGGGMLAGVVNAYLLKPDE
jgi:glycerol uptake facilitator-like aquaporin